MSIPDNNTFDKQLNDKLQDHETEYSANAWESMQTKLDNVKKPLFGSVLKRPVIIGSILILLLFISFFTGYEFKKQDSNHARMDLPGGKSNAKAPISKQSQRLLSIENKKLTAANNINAPVLRNSDYSAKKWIEHSNRSDEQFASFNASADHLASTNNELRLEKTDNNITNFSAKSQESGTSDIIKKAADSVIKSKGDQVPDKILKIPVTDNLIKSNDLAGQPLSDKRTISFGPYLGFNWNTTVFYQGSESSGDDAIGAFINFPLTDKLSLQSGLGFDIVSDKWLMKSDTIIANNDIHGKIYQVTEQGTGAIGYLHLPLILKYKLSRKFKVSIGPQISYALTAPVSSNVADYKKDNMGHYQPLTPTDSLPSSPAGWWRQISNYNPDVYHFSIEMQLGIDWNMSKSFDLSLIYFRGLTNVLKTPDQYISTVGNINNNTFQLRLGYKLFHKRFPED